MLTAAPRVRGRAVEVERAPGAGVKSQQRVDVAVDVRRRPCTHAELLEPARAAGLLVLLGRGVGDDERRDAGAHEVERGVVAALADARRAPGCSSCGEVGDASAAARRWAARSLASARVVLVRHQRAGDRAHRAAVGGVDRLFEQRAADAPAAGGDDDVLAARGARWRRCAGDEARVVDRDGERRRCGLNVSSRRAKRGSQWTRIRSRCALASRARAVVVLCWFSRG